MKSNYQVAIDGPSGSGKSTIAKLIAQKLGFLYIDSGAMYRAVTLFLIKHQILNKSEHELKRYVQKIKIKFINNQHILLNNSDVTRKIRTSQINKFVSMVSAKKSIRIEMTKRQREFAKLSSIVMDGRDIGTTVFPNAHLKIYLTASLLIRAKRRKKDLKETNENLSTKEIINLIRARDNYDSSRTMSPLCKAQDAIVIDSTNMSIKEVLKQICFFIPFKQ